MQKIQSIVDAHSCSTMPPLGVGVVADAARVQRALVTMLKCRPSCKRPARSPHGSRTSARRSRTCNEAADACRSGDTHRVVTETVQLWVFPKFRPSVWPRPEVTGGAGAVAPHPARPAGHCTWGAGTAPSASAPEGAFSWGVRVLFGPARFGRMRRWPSRRWSSSHPLRASDS
jgi:hypothetical protein